NTTCSNALPNIGSRAYRSSCRGDSRAANSCSATRIEVIKTESDKSTPTIPIIPTVSARPCQKVRDVVFQILFKERSMTENTHEPAQTTMMTQLMIMPVLTEESDRIVSRRNFADAG